MDVNFRISLTDGSTRNGNCLDIFCGQIELIPKVFRLHLHGMDFTPEKTVLPRAEWLLESNGIQFVLDPRNDHIRGVINLAVQARCQHSVVPPGSQYWRAAGCHHWQAAGHTAQGTQRDGTEAAACGADAPDVRTQPGTYRNRWSKNVSAGEMFRSKPEVTQVPRLSVFYWMLAVYDICCSERIVKPNLCRTFRLWDPHPLRPRASSRSTSAPCWLFPGRRLRHQRLRQRRLRH